MSDSYIKYGAVQDTAYWTENYLARSNTDTEVVLALARPSLSNTIVFKSGSFYNVSVAVMQKSTDAGAKAFGQGSVEWFITESS